MNSPNGAFFSSSVIVPKLREFIFYQVTNNNSWFLVFCFVENDFCVSVVSVKVQDFLFSTINFYSALLQMLLEFWQLDVD
jgi:hypothetical protein